VNISYQLFATFGLNRLEEAIQPFGSLGAVSDGFARVPIAIRLRRYRLAHETKTSHAPFANIKGTIYKLHVPTVVKDLANLRLVVGVKFMEFHPLMLERLFDGLDFQHMVCVLPASNFSLFIEIYRLPGRCSSWGPLDSSDVGC
jgi:hypothetical protein